jgi:pheromone shutdown protein TraB
MAERSGKNDTEVKKHLQYKLLFERLEKGKIPVLFADVKYKYNNFALILADNFFTTAEWIGGMRAISQLIRNGNKLKRGFVASFAYGLAGAWLLLPVVSNMTRLVSSITGEGMKQSARLKKLSHKLHPEAELLYLSLRNAVIAEKAYHLAQTCGKKAHIAIVLGAGHVGIEDMLIRSHAERMNYLRKFQSLLHRIVLPEYLYSIIRMGYNGKEWRRTKRCLH